MIEGVILKPLRQIKDDRGKVMHMLRADDPMFTEFGEIYFSQVLPGVIKAWKLHTKMTQNYAVVSGNIRVVIHDSREGSLSKGQTDEYEIGQDNYALLRIPKGVWSGFVGLGDMPALIANCTDLPHDPEEVIKREPDNPPTPYKWDRS